MDVTVPIPPEYLREDAWTPSGRLRVRYEEEGTFWPWYEPGLVWPVPIVWLFSPCETNRTWPGDLWGVDENGDLVVVESKRVGKGRPYPASEDPFQDFVGTADQPYERPDQPDFEVDRLREQWRGLLDHERALPRITHDPGGTKSILGVVPYSVRRTYIAAWPHICESVNRWVRSSKYEETAEKYLRRRRTAAEPPAHYVGLFVIAGDGGPGLTPRGKEHLQKLRDMAGPERVHTAAVWGTKSSDEGMMHLHGESVDVESLLRSFPSHS